MLKLHLAHDPSALPEEYRNGFPVVFTPNEGKADIAACGTRGREQHLTTLRAMVTCKHCRKL